MTIIAYYRDKEGKIVGHHDSRGKTLEEMKKLADDVCPPVAEDGLLRGFEKHGLC